MNTTIPNRFNEQIPTDEDSFMFNIKSNGRFDKPMQYSIRDTDCGIKLFENENTYLCQLGDILLMKKESKEYSIYLQNEDHFNYQNIPNAICQTNENNQFNMKRIIVYKLK